MYLFLNFLSDKEIEFPFKNKLNSQKGKMNVLTEKVLKY